MADKRSVEALASLGGSLHQLRDMRRTARGRRRADIDAEIERRHRENLGLQPSMFPRVEDALVELMRAMRLYGRPSSYPPEVRDAWDQCERVLGDNTSRAIHLERPL
jgi:hypothetical protein